MPAFIYTQRFFDGVEEPARAGETPRTEAGATRHRPAPHRECIVFPHENVRDPGGQPPPEDGKATPHRPAPIYPRNQSDRGRGSKIPAEVDRGNDPGAAQTETGKSERG